MPMTLSYRLIRAGSMSDLEEQVEKFGLRGFKPKGGVAVWHNTLHEAYYQAMVKYE